MGNCKDFGNAIDKAGNWAKTYDSITAIHPPWHGNVTNQGFIEYCIKDPKKCKIYSLIYKGIELKFAEYQSQMEILNLMKKLP